MMKKGLSDRSEHISTEVVRELTNILERKSPPHPSSSPKVPAFYAQSIHPRQKPPRPMTLACFSPVTIPSILPRPDPAYNPLRYLPLPYRHRCSAINHHSSSKHQPARLIDASHHSGRGLPLKATVNLCPFTSRYYLSILVYQDNRRRAPSSTRVMRASLPLQLDQQTVGLARAGVS